MTLRAGYRKLTRWNKLNVWGAVASIVGVALTLAFCPRPRRTTPIHTTKFEFYEPKVGQPAAANVHYKVTAPAIRVQGNGTLFVLTPRNAQTDWEVGLQEAWTEAAKRWKGLGPERVISESQDVYFTVVGPPLLDSEINALLAGSSALFLAGQLKYSGDSDGTMEFCVFLKNGAKILCPAHNGPVK
jgi:hypothetical protein